MVGWLPGTPPPHARLRPGGRGERPAPKLTPLQREAVEAMMSRAFNKDDVDALKQEGVWDAFVDDTHARLGAAKESGLQASAERGGAALRHAGQWLSETLSERDLLEAGARRFAMTLGRVAELALLVDHAQWCLDHDKGERALAAARRFARSRVDLIEDDDFMAESRLLVD